MTFSGARATEDSIRGVLPRGTDQVEGQEGVPRLPGDSLSLSSYL